MALSVRFRVWHVKTAVNAIQTAPARAGTRSPAALSINTPFTPQAPPAISAPTETEWASSNKVALPAPSPRSCQSTAQAHEVQRNEESRVAAATPAIPYFRPRYIASSSLRPASDTVAIVSVLERPKVTRKLY